MSCSTPLMRSAIRAIDVGDRLDAPRHVVDALADQRERLARAVDARGARLGALGAGLDHRRGRGGHVLHLADQRRRSCRRRSRTPRRACGPPRPRPRSRGRCSPARAASIAALSASRFVCSAIAVIVAAMPPMSSDFALRPRIDSAAAVEDSRTACIASKTSLTALPPASAASRVRCAAATVSCASATPCCVAAATSSVVERALPGAVDLASRRRAPRRRPPGRSRPPRGRSARTRRPSRCDVPETLSALRATRPIASDERAARVVVGADRGQRVLAHGVDGAGDLAELVAADVLDRLRLPGRSRRSGRGARSPPGRRAARPCRARRASAGGRRSRRRRCAPRRRSRRSR